MTGRRTHREQRRRAVRRSRFRRTTDPTDPQTRLFVLLLTLAVCGLALGAKLFSLQAVRPDRYVAEGERQRTRVETVEAFRGQIVDRSGFVLASSTPSFEVVANPQSLAPNDPYETARLLAPELGVAAEDLLEALLPVNEDDQYGLVARNVDRQTAVALQDLAEDKTTKRFMAGIFVRPDEHRVYPAGALAKPIVGRVDPDEIGIFGIEKQFDDAMSAVQGSEQYEGGRFGSISGGESESTPAIAGLDVVLTIDHRIQFVVEEALRDHCSETRANGATAVLTEPGTGNILAMASVVRGEDGSCYVPNHNKALVEWFEPGSVLKTVTAAAAIEELGYTPRTAIDVPPKIRIGDQTFHDDPTHPAAPFPLSEILARSMNVGTITMAQAVGPGEVYNYQRRFGLGQGTGLDWPGESSGKVVAPADWWGSDAGSIPIGQGITVTAGQLVAAYNAIANQGSYRSLRLVDGLRTAEDSIIPIEVPPSRPVVSKQTAAYLTELLSGVVTDGTGRSAAIDGYQVAGKTGTAWKVFDNGSGQHTYGTYRDRRYVVTFAGFVPAANPALSMVIVVDEPKTATTASAVAAPIFAEVGLYALQILGIAPDRPTPLDGQKVRAPVALEAESAIGGVATQ